MIDAKTAQKWTKMAKERIGNDPYIKDIFKAKFKSSDDVFDAVFKYVHKSILATAKVTGNSSVKIDFARIRKSITANPNALTLLAKDNQNTSHIYNELVKLLEYNNFSIVELKSDEVIIIDWEITHDNQSNK